MCTLLFAYKMHPKYDLIFLGNRDEFKSRPSKSADFWSSHPNVLGGIDLEQGGTWTGITGEGRLAFITNYRNPSLKIESALSRGYLTRDFLTSSISPEEYLQAIQLKASAYNPFNLVVGTINDLWFYSNVENEIRQIKAGVYGLSNGLLDTPWYKVKKGKARLAKLLSTYFSIEDIFEILDDTEVPPDKDLPETGVPIETERMLSSIHIDSQSYGTIFKTIILITPQGNVSFYEKLLKSDGDWQLNNYSFNINE